MLRKEGKGYRIPVMVMKYPAAVMTVLLAACGGGPVHVDAGGDTDAGETAELQDAEAEGEGPDAPGDPDAPDGELDEGDGVEARDWVRYDGEVPDVAAFSKDDHIASCMRTRACYPENLQQMATCTSAYAHIVGREIGMTLGWVARCAVEAPLDCAAVRACMGNGAEPEPCTPLETPDRCDGSVLRQCSRASGLTFSFDCAHVGMGCYLDEEGTAHCGLGGCSVDDFLAGCFADTLVLCEKGVIVPAQCTAAGLVCVEPEGEPGRCAGDGEPCDEAEVERACDGDRLSGCLGGRLAGIRCGDVIDGWTCGPSEGTLGCVVPGDECWAYPLLGSSIDESCDGDSVVTCLDGFITRLACSDFGLGSCTDLGTAARCTPP
jgi:hypothetical protein